MNLDTDQKEKIHALLRRLKDARQKELAVAMDYDTGNLSEFLNPAKAKGVDVGTWRKLVAALPVLAERRGDQCRKDPSIAATIKEISGWPEDSKKAARPGNGTRLYRPGGAMPLDAVNRVERDSCKKIPKIIDHPGPCSVLLQGGIGSGRSSWLLRLQKAAEATGARVVVFDEAFLSRSNGSDPVAAFLAHLGEVLGQPSLSQLTTHQKDSRQIVPEVIRILGEVAPSTSLYLLVDEVTAWPEGERHRALVSLVTEMLTELVGGWGRLNPPPIRIVSVLTPLDWSALIGSKLEGQSTAVKFGFLQGEEVTELAHSYGLNGDLAAQVIAFSGGHLLHTQMLLWACHQGASVDEAVARARDIDDGHGWLGVSTRLMKTLQHLTEAQSIDLRQMLKRYVGRFGETGDQSSFLSDQEWNVLKSVGVVDGSRKKPMTSQFFLSAARAWLEDGDE